MDNFTFHIKMLNDKVRAMNQSNSKILTLNAQEARNLQAEIYDLMATIASLTKPEEVVSINMDGGSFK
jgi:hypothetical protein